MTWSVQPSKRKYEAAELLRHCPDSFIGLARISAFDGMRGVRELDIPVRIYSSMNYATDRPYGLGQAGSGWEMPMQFGNTLIQDKVLVGRSAGLGGQLLETLIKEYLELPLKDAVKEKWLCGNAARVFGLE